MIRWFNTLMIQCLICFMLASCGGGSGEDSASMQPVLTELDIGGGTLRPSFSPSISRYSVLLNDGVSDLTVRAVADSNSSIAVNGSLAASESTTLSEVNEGDTIELDVTDSNGAVSSIEILVLPADFPVINVTTLSDGAMPGYTYVGLRGPVVHYIAALDNHGVPKYYMKTEGRANNFTRHDNGLLSYSIPNTETGTALGKVSWQHVILNNEFQEIRRMTTLGLVHTDFHEFLIQQNGNAILLAYEPAVRDLTAFGGAVNGDVQDSVIQEISADGELLYEWNSWGKVRYEDELREADYDYAHLNSIDVDSDGNWLFVARGTSQVSKIDKASGELLWTLGGKSNDFQYINDPYSNLCGPHTVSRLGNGNILLFDNGQYCWPEVESRGELTRIVEYKIDEANLTAELVWSYSKDGAVSLSGGSAQRLPNGNTMIGWNRGPNVLTTEVDRSGNVVFEFEAVTKDGVAVQSYRSLKFSE